MRGRSAPWSLTGAVGAHGSQPQPETLRRRTGAGHDQHGVITGHRSRDLIEAGAIERVRHQRCGTRCGVHHAEQVDELDRVHVLAHRAAQALLRTFEIQLRDRRHVARARVIVDAEQAELPDVAAHRCLGHIEVAAAQLLDEILLRVDDLGAPELENGALARYLACDAERTRSRRHYGRSSARCANASRRRRIASSTSSRPMISGGTRRKVRAPTALTISPARNAASASCGAMSWLRPTPSIRPRPRTCSTGAPSPASDMIDSER